MNFSQDIIVYLGIGGNIEPVLPRLKEALHLLSMNTHVSQLKISQFYCTSPFQMHSPHWFINTVCSFSTTLSPNDVFKMTQAIEIEFGKTPKEKNHDRNIDIDILFYGSQFYKDHELEIPHPRWKERLFVLKPLADLTQEITLRHHGKTIRYLISDFIEPLEKQSSQIISLIK